MKAIVKEIVQATEEESVMQARTIGALPRWFPVPGIRFEFAEEGAGGAAVAEPPADPTPAPDPAAVAPEPEPAAAPDPEFAQIPRHEYDELRSGMGMLRSLGELIEAERETLLQPPAEDPASTLPPLPEPFSPTYAQEMQAYLDARDAQTREAAIAPYAPLLTDVARSQGETFTNQAFERLEADPEVGSFDRRMATRTAAFLVRGGEEPDRALEVAAREHAAYERRTREAAVAEHIERARRLGDLPPEAPANPGSAEVTPSVPTGPRRYDRQLEDSLSRMAPAPPE